MTQKKAILILPFLKKSLYSSGRDYGHDLLRRDYTLY